MNFIYLYGFLHIIFMMFYVTKGITYDVLFWQGYRYFNLYRLATFRGLKDGYVVAKAEGLRFYFLLDETDLIFNKPPILEKLVPGFKVIAPISMSVSNRLVYADTTVKSVTAGQVSLNVLKNIIKPYPNRGQTEEQRIFNYRLSRARRVSENGFGILSTRFSVYHTTLCVRLQSAASNVHATLVLHNYLLRQSAGYATPDNLTSEDQTGTIENLARR